MSKPNVLLRLECSASPSPGCSWDAWLEVHRTKRGCSVWSDGSDGKPSQGVKFGEISGFVDWRKVAKLFREMEEGFLGEDLRREIHVAVSPDGWPADILALCWIHDFDSSYNQVASFLLNQDDISLAYLSAQLGCFTDDRSMDAIVKLIDLLDSSDVTEVSALIDLHSPDNRDISFERLLSLLEAADERAQAEYEMIRAERDKQRQAALSLFIPAIEALFSDLTKSWGSGSNWASGIAISSRKHKLRQQIEEFVLSNRRLPTAGELDLSQSTRISF